MKIYRSGPETERLTHRAFTVDDAEAFYALNTNPDVMRYTGEPMPASLDAVRDALATYPDFDTVGYGRWACVLKETGAVIGFCGLKHLPELGEVDVGFRFLPEHWGKGLGTEACRASVTFGFEVFGLTSIIGLVLPENTASIRVLEKCGLRRAGEVVYDGETAWRYEITR